jgi:hypothetical protein
VVWEEGDEPTQDTIQDALFGMDHVRQLVQSIKENGGLIDPIIVQAGSNIVLEGNSRLAAYRLLAKQDPIKWARLRAKVVPESMSESDIFCLLGEYHIIGKKDWAPFEQAGYLYRRHHTHGVTIEQLAKEINLSKRTISHLVDVYRFMLENDERDLNRWSYFDEYLKSNKIKRARQKYPELDKQIIRKIRNGEISKAVDIRDGLEKIVEGGGKNLAKFAAGKVRFADSYEAALHRGIGDQGVRHLKKFKEWLVRVETQNGLVQLDGEPRKQAMYDLKKIQTVIVRVLRTLDS